MTEIKVKHVNKAYGDKKVLEDFSASFEYGRCTAIMGESGCGKTTLLNILMGLDRDFDGCVQGMPERFGVVFQEDRLCEEFTVMDNIRMVMGTKSVDAIEQCLGDLGLKEYASQKVSELSGGQKRRVAIARALMYDAELILMDEPFKGLDEDTRKAVIEAIKQRQRTIIMVTHNPEEVDMMEAELVTMERVRQNISTLL